MGRKQPICLSVPVLALLAACNGTPTPGGSCQSTRDCVTGEVCVAGSCTPAEPKQRCTTDQQCGAGEWCDLGEERCKPLAGDSGVPMKDAEPSDSSSSDASEGSCIRDQECGTPPVDICVANQCVKGCNEPGGLTCTGGTQCDSVTGHCVNVNTACTLDGECMPGPPVQICINQTCVAGCGFNAALCAQGTEVCDTNTGRCVPAPTSCTNDNGCNPPQTVCESMQCVPGCNAVGGVQCSGATPNCNAATGRCVAAPTCQLDSECTPPDEICVNSACVVRCDRPGGINCGTNFCNPDDGRCLPGNLPLGDRTCVRDEQCATGICLGITVGGQSLQICTDPCGATSQCPLDFSCLSVSGMGFCLSETLFNPPATFDTPAGGTCTAANNTCQSFWCNTGQSQCIETCSRNADCANFGGNCSMFTQDNMGTPEYDNLCFNGGGTVATGAACAANADCRSGICNRYDAVCAAHCCTDADCPAAQSCSLYDIDANTIMKVCRNRGAMSGTAPLGATCTAPSDCESEVCAAVNPDDQNSPRRCSTLCCRDADCSILPQGGRCRPAGTPIAGQIVGACVPN